MRLLSTHVHDLLSIFFLLAVDGVIASTMTIGEKIFKAAEEVMISEKTFLTIITMLDVDFRSFIDERNTDSEIVPHAKFYEIFSNMGMIRNLSSILFNDFSDRIENWCDNYKIADVLIMKGDFLKIFADYGNDYHKNMPHLLDELLANYPRFKEAVNEYEKQECCRCMPISSFFIKPVQRIPQYQMLMKEYLKQISKTQNVHPDKEDAEIALDIVTNAVVHVNEHIRKNTKFNELLELRERLGNPDDLIKQGRYLIHHGVIKWRTYKEVKWRYLILCNDVLIVTKSTAITTDLSENSKHSLIISREFELEYIYLEESFHKQEYPYDFHVYGKQKSYIFFAKNAEEKTEWMELLGKTIKDRISAIGRFIGDYIDRNELGIYAPIMIPHENVTLCKICSCEFGFFNPKYNCQACGYVFCSKCTSKAAKLKYRNNDSKKVCYDCNDVLKHAGMEEILYRQSWTEQNEKMRICARDEGIRIYGTVYKFISQNKGWKKAVLILKGSILYKLEGIDDNVANECTDIEGYKLYKYNVRFEIHILNTDSDFY